MARYPRHIDSIDLSEFLIDLIKNFESFFITRLSNQFLLWFIFLSRKLKLAGCNLILQNTSNDFTEMVSNFRKPEINFIERAVSG